jgi:hypothetical protein
MSKKHNKKRNAGILYETLIREFSKAKMAKDDATATCIKEMIRQFFHKGTELNRELSIYREVLECNDMNQEEFEKFLQEAKLEYAKINRKRLNDQKSSLISKINKDLSPSVFQNFVPSYRSLATIHQIFNSTSIKKRMMLEQKLINATCQPQEKIAELEHVDELVYRLFVKKFNEKYSSMLNEQKAFLSRYVRSLDGNGVEFKFYLNEELGRIKQELQEHFAHLSCGNKVQQLHETLEGYRNEDITQEMIGTILVTYEILSEIK